MTLQDSQKNLQDADQIGVISSINNTVTSSIFSNNMVLYSNASKTNTLFNGTQSSQLFVFEIFSSDLSSGNTALVELNTPKLHSPLTMYIKTATDDTTVVAKTFTGRLIPGASVTFSIKSNSPKSSKDNLIVKITQKREGKPCKSCKQAFGVDDKYTNAFILLMVTAILAILIFEFLLDKKEEKV